MRVRVRSEPLSPSPSYQHIIDAAYSDLAPLAAERASFFETYFRTHRDRLAFDLGYVEQYATKSDTIADVGCSPLLLLRALQREGYSVQGIDLHPDEFSAAIARYQMQVARCDIEREKLPLQDASCDVLIFNEVFEHLRINPPFTLRELYRVAKPGARLLLSTPNLRSLRGMINFVLRDRGISDAWDVYTEFEKLDKYGHMGHIREYTFTEVRELLERLGWQVVERICRARYQRRIVSYVVRCMPRYRPFMSIVAIKPAT